MIAQNIEVTLFVGDALSNTVFSNTAINIKGVGTNENKALIEAIKTISPKNKEITAFLEEGKNKIINYYATQCDFIIKEAQTLEKQQKFDEAIYKLALVPEVCKDCYYKCLDELTSIYQKKIDEDCKLKFNEAKTTWSANQSPAGAEKVGDILSGINPMATCQNEVNTFINQIDAKLKADEKARWQFKMQQYADKIAIKKEQIRTAEEKGKRDDVYREKQSQRDAVLQEKQSSRNLELDKIRTIAYKEVAVEQAKNQPKTVTYNNIFWR
jgi:predicted Rdx family selenoprotein